MNTIVVVILILLFIFVVVPLLAFMFMVKTVDNAARDLGKGITRSVEAHKKAQETMKFPSALAGYQSRLGKLPKPGIMATNGKGRSSKRYSPDYFCTPDKNCAAIAFSKDGYSWSRYQPREACKLLEEGNLIDAPRAMQEGTLFKDTLNCAPFENELPPGSNPPTNQPTPGSPLARARAAGDAD